MTALSRYYNPRPGLVSSLVQHAFVTKALTLAKSRKRLRTLKFVGERRF